MSISFRSFCIAGCAAVFGLGSVCAEAVTASDFRSAQQLVAKRVPVSDTNRYTCGSAPISCVDETTRTLYAPYLTSTTAHGESHDIVALAVVPLDDPDKAVSKVVVAKNDDMGGTVCTSVIDQSSILRDEKLRVYFLANYSTYKYRDYDPATETFGSVGDVKCCWEGAETNDLAQTPLADYLKTKGLTYSSTDNEPVIVTAKPVLDGSSFYGTVTSSSSCPVFFRCTDGETFEFLGAIPALGEYECQIARLNGRFYAVIRGVASGANFWYSDDGGRTWNPIGRLPLALTRPQLLVWKDQLLVAYSSNDILPNPHNVRNGRNNMTILAGEGVSLQNFVKVFEVTAEWGFVYYDIVTVGGELYCLWSDSSVYPTMLDNGVLQGKDAVFFSRLSRSSSEVGDGDRVLGAVKATSDAETGNRIKVSVAPGAVTNTTALFLCWGDADGGDDVYAWSGCRLLTDALTPAGGTFELEAGVPAGVRVRAIAAQTVAGCLLYDALEPDGVHVLDTGVYHTQADEVTIDVLIDRLSTSVNTTLYGCRGVGDGMNQVEAFFDYRSKLIGDFRNANDPRYRLNVGCGDSFGSICGSRLTITLGSGGVSAVTSDGKFSSRSDGGYTTAFTCDRTASIFGVNGTSDWEVPSAMRLYGISIRRGGEPFRDYVPACSNGVAGLVDRVTGAFLSDASANFGLIPRQPDASSSSVILGSGEGETVVEILPSSALSAIPAVGTVTVVQDRDYTQPFFQFALGGDEGYSAVVTLYCGTEDGGSGTWQHSRVLTPGAGYGAVLDEGAGLYFHNGETVYWKITAEATGGSDTVTGSFAVSGTQPPWIDVPVQANVVYVRPGALNVEKSGDSWSDPCTTVYDALAAFNADTTKTEIWVAATNVVSALHPSVGLSRACTVRGGFLGWEETAADRPEGFLSVIDGDLDYNGLTVENAAALEIERILFTRAKASGLVKTGAGNLDVHDCRFYNNNSPESGTVYGLGLNANPNNENTEIRVKNCVFDRNQTRSDDPNIYGFGIYVGKAKRLIVDDTLFATNGSAPGIFGCRDCFGVAIYTAGAPVTLRGSRFVGNRGSINSQGAPMVYVSGTAAASGVTNCLFLANEARVDQNCEHLHELAGQLVFSLSSATTPCEVVNCTFAYGLYPSAKGSGALNVFKGAAKVRNSIFYGNLVKRTYPYSTETYDATAAADISVGASGSVDVGWSLFATEDPTFSRRVVSGGSINEHDCVYGDPLFVTPFSSMTNAIASSSADLSISNTYHVAGRAYYKANTDYRTFNCHLRGKRGYTDEFDGQLYQDRTVKTNIAVDAGDPKSDYSGEPAGANGRRVNLGFYGNTPYATRSASVGFMLFVK